MMEKKQQHKKKRGKVQHIRGSPKREENIWKSCFFFREYPRKNACGCEKSDHR